MRWPRRRRLREGGIVPPASAVLLREGECTTVLPSAVVGTSYAPPTLTGCALDITDDSGRCPYCGRRVPHQPIGEL